MELRSPDWSLDLREKNLDISHPISRPSLNRPQSKNPQHSHAMPPLVLNRSVQFQPKSWRDFVKVIYGQALRDQKCFLDREKVRGDG